MSNINQINFGVNANQFFRQEEKEDLTQGTKKDAESAQGAQKKYESSEILGFMASQNIDIIPVKTQKTLDVSKYVTPEQEARISDFMNNFQADYDYALNETMQEFPDLSEEAAGSIALAFVNSSYDEA